MKTKLIAAVLLPVVGLLLVLGGTSYAQSFDDHQPIHQSTISTTVYLPIVVKPSCEVAAYVTASSPVVEVGQFFTVTGAIVNVNCPPIGERWITLEASPSGATSPEAVVSVPGGVIPTGQYQPVWTRFQALQTGPVTFDLSINYDSLAKYVFAEPSVIRIVPHNP